MAVQTVFQRYELKYIMTQAQQRRLLQTMEGYMAPDQYGDTTIRDLHFDTPTYRLIRQSIDKPVYKEKLRVRCYSQAGPDTTVFVELKKKYRSVVYKRRIALPERQAPDHHGDRYREHQHEGHQIRRRCADPGGQLYHRRGG